ncbi:hypothetical protein [Buttiauxella selenatireducens]|uniref:hypothetical protein n=1 Tax=Buttiauxella selenatireducens TaxID=3073902 RepID=UPI0035B54EBD
MLSVIARLLSFSPCSVVRLALTRVFSFQSQANVTSAAIVSHQRQCVLSESRK